MRSPGRRPARFEILAIRGKRTTRGRGLAALGLLLVLALVATGCGGDSGGSESASRKKLEAGGAKLSAAKSFEVSLQVELEEEGENEEAGCVDLGVDSHGTESIDLRYYDLNCSGGSEGSELIAIGHRAWASTEPGRYAAAKITSEVAHELDDEQTTDLQGLFEAAEDIEADSEGGAIEEAGGKFVDVTRYSFEASASAFPDSEDLGDTKIDFDATLDRKGFLRELVLHGEEDGTGVTVTETYTDIEADLGIHPPDPSEVHGAVQSITSKTDLEALLGTTP
jgi:hypothetical protein